jgi:hypothetical protein
MPIPKPDVTICPYPKHYGKKWADIMEEDAAYIEWLVSLNGPPMHPDRFDYLMDLLEDSPSTD